MGDKQRCLVTGGSGFLGQTVVKHLLQHGSYDVTIFDIRPPPSSAGLDAAHFVKGDLRNEQKVEDVCKGMDVVFHVATAAPTGANSLNNQLMESVNVKGTRNVIEGCVKQKVGKLIFTSSASVVFDGRDLIDVDEESVGYAARPMDYYTATKIEAERMILESNGRGDTLATCALRPSAIFGEGDAVFVPTLVERAQKGKMKFIVGNGKNLMDFTHVGNVAQAHVLAAERLSLKSQVAGRAYFITNQEPKPFWGFLGDICEGLGYERPWLKLPYLLMLFFIMIFEYLIVPFLRLFMEVKTDMTVYRIKLSVRNRIFSSHRARRDLSYEPQVSMKEGLRRTLEAFKHLRKEALMGDPKPPTTAPPDKQAKAS